MKQNKNEIFVSGLAVHTHTHTLQTIYGKEELYLLIPSLERKEVAY